MITNPIRNAIISLKTKKDFSIDCRKFLKFIDNSNLETFPKVEDGPTVQVVVVPWLFTAVPWYSITIALLLRYNGKKVQIVFDDTNFDDLSTGIRNSARWQCSKIEVALTRLKSVLPFTKISEMKDSLLTEDDKHALAQLAKLNRIHRFKTALQTQEYMDYQNRWYQLQIKHLGKIKSFFSQHKGEQIIIPGGVYGNSGLYIHAINNLSKVSTFDSGKGRALICVNGIAGYQSDISVVLSHEAIRNMETSARDCINQLALQELNKRISGTDSYCTQTVPADQDKLDKGYDIILPLNITWDLPALGKHRFFADDFDWIVETVSWVLINTDATIAVRQHPHERNHTSGRDLKAAIRNKFAGSGRFRFFSCEEKINSYTLISKSKVVLPYVSTIGIEAALLGKAVVMESSCYYAKSSFVVDSQSKADYFKKIAHYLSHPLTLTEDQKNEAFLYYYIGQVCTAEITSFTPFRSDFNDWVKAGLKELKNDVSVNKITRSFLDRVPLALLSHMEILTQQTGALFQKRF